MAFESQPVPNIQELLRANDGHRPAANALDLHMEARHTKHTGHTGHHAHVTDNTGHVQFPNVYASSQAGDAGATAAGPTHDYTVKKNDSLWKIAKESLTHGDRHVHVTGEDVWHRIKDIVDLNIKDQPGMKANPYYVWKGENLHLPGAADAPSPVAPIAPVAPVAGVTNHGRIPGTPALTRVDVPTGTARTPGLPDVSGPKNPATDGGHLANAIKGEADHQARHIGTVGDCARGPRQTLAKFGLVLRPMTAVSQGQALEKSGLFDRVDPKEVQPGDYGYRHWSAHTIKRRGLGDLGDSFIVTNCNRKGLLQAANDHTFIVPPGGGYYAPGITYLRPNAKFQALFEHYKQTGQKTYMY